MMFSESLKRVWRGRGLILYEWCKPEISQLQIRVLCPIICIFVLTTTLPCRKGSFSYWSWAQHNSVSIGMTSLEGSVTLCTLNHQRVYDLHGHDLLARFPVSGRKSLLWSRPLSDWCAYQAHVIPVKRKCYLISCNGHSVLPYTEKH